MAANKATVNISASVLPDDMKASVSGSIVYNLNDGAGDACKWISYAQDIGASNEVLLVADIGYLQGTAGDTTPTRTHADDNVEFIIIKHSGFKADGTTATTAQLFFNFTNGVVAANAAGNLCLDAGEAWCGKFNTAEDTANFTAISSSSDIKVLIYAVLDDVA